MKSRHRFQSLDERSAANTNVTSGGLGKKVFAARSGDGHNIHLRELCGEPCVVHSGVAAVAVVGEGVASDRT